MKLQRAVFAVIACCAVLWLAEASAAKPAAQRHEWTPVLEAADTVGDVDGVLSSARKAALDTIWIADWTFDGGSACDDSGWIKKDNLIRSDGIHHWFVDSSFDGSGNITGHGAILAEHDLCWVFPDGYDNDWYTALRFEYEGDGATYLSFDFLVDSEGGFDFLQVETDSACASFDRVDYTGPYGPGSASPPAYGFRRLEFSVSGFDTSASTTHIDSLELTDHGPGTHCCYIAFQADGAWSPADGLQPTTLGVAMVVDNIVVEGMTSLSEDFETSPPYAVDFENIQEREPFGEWARVYKHITDNDACTENPTCAWLATDYTTPTIANDPSMAFAPGSFVILNWLDDLVHSPWVSLASTPGASGTVLSFRRFPGNSFTTARIVQNWAVRSKLKIDNSDTPATGDSIDCLSSWGHVSQWNSLSAFRWISNTWNMESYFDPSALEIQLRFRISDWQWIASPPPPVPHIPGPGPFWDRVRIGRRILTGPVLDPGIDTRTQAQDAFATEPIMFSLPNWAPSADRFGSAAFSRGSELTFGAHGPNLVLGDSITVNVQDVRGAGGITAVEWYGSIVSGPHIGKAPPPWSVGANGFFAVPSDSVRDTSGNVAENNWFVSLDDEYFRGGDVLLYFWLATDVLGGVSSEPQGLNAIPATLAEAQLATNGLHEVSFLPKINWDTGYLARVENDAHGKLEPTQDELANSAQANCILYYEIVNSARRSGDLNRTSLMHTLDVLGYQDLYDVYDHQGLGNTNNHLGGRATVQQATGYALIVYDAGNRSPGVIIPDGSLGSGTKVDQAGWFQEYLGQASFSETGSANLWLLGSNVAEESSSNPLLSTDIGVVFVSGNQGLSNNPDILGQTAMVFSNSNSAEFAGDLFSAAGGCPSIRNYDALDVSGTATITHRYKDPSSPTLGDGAVVMNANAPEKWNTILQSFAWSDIRDPQSGPTSPSPEEALLGKILGALLVPGCEGEPSTDVLPQPEMESARLRTRLYQNVPNPFNPVTTIRFDLSRDGRVELAIHDVAGRLVRTLVKGSMTSGAQRVVWHGLDTDGKSVPSGVYLCRLRAAERVATQKLMVLR